MISSKTFNILYVGELCEGGTCLQRMKTLKELGHKVVSLDTYPEAVLKMTNTFAYRAWHKFFGPVDLAKINKAILQKLEKQTFDILWIDKGRTIKPSTLKSVRRLQKNCIIAGYSPDDMTGNKSNQSRRFLRSLPHFDIYISTKTYCLSELEALGCPRAAFIGNAYDKYVHRPVPVTAEDKKRFGGAVGFIGHWEPDRAKSLCFLADSGIDIRVWGYRWQRCKRRPEKLCLEKGPLWADDYARAICAFDINLCFLRKANRDLQTTRSIEIPACGGFMLAERTNEHLELFEEGKEAEFFDDEEELLDKVKYYLAHDEERKRIGRAGRQRCLNSGYSNHNRLKKVIDKIVALLQ